MNAAILQYLKTLTVCRKVYYAEYILYSKLSSMGECLLYSKSSMGRGNLLWGKVYSMKPDVSAEHRLSQRKIVLQLRAKS